MQKESITLLLPAGRLPLGLMEGVQKLAQLYDFSIYLSTLQNLRLIDVPTSAVNRIKEELVLLGADFKENGKFPIPRICIGKDHCKLGVIDTELFSQKIMGEFGYRKENKGKIKIAISGCAMSCSGAKTSDIGIVATRKGLEVYTGGKGGTSPQVGRRIAKMVDEESVMQVIAELLKFHDKKTKKKQRMFKLLGDAEFPYSEV